MLKWFLYSVEYVWIGALIISAIIGEFQLGRFLLVLMILWDDIIICFWIKEDFDD